MSGCVQEPGCRGSRAHLPDSFFTIFLSEMTTPYTSLASSSNANPVLVKPVCPAAAASCDGGRGGAGNGMSLLIATTVPVDEVNVFLGEL